MINCHPEHTCYFLDLAEQLVQLKDDFKLLVTATLRSLMFSNETALETLMWFRNQLFTEPNVKFRYGSWITGNMKRLVKIESMEEMFASLGELWSFLDPDLLRVVINDFGFASDKLKEDARLYMENFDRITKTAKVNELIQVFPSSSHHRDNSHNVTIGVNQNSSEWTIADIVKLKEDLCREMMLIDCAMTVASLKEGSIWVTWHVSDMIASQLPAVVTKYSRLFFKDYQVLELEVDGVILYKSKPSSPAAG